eukprot:1195905-Prorocentrum_minimum.AAC.5
MQLLFNNSCWLGLYCAMHTAPNCGSLKLRSLHAAETLRFPFCRKYPPPRELALQLIDQLQNDTPLTMDNPLNRSSLDQGLFSRMIMPHPALDIVPHRRRSGHSAPLCFSQA